MREAIEQLKLECINSLSFAEADLERAKKFTHNSRAIGYFESNIINQAYFIERLNEILKDAD